MAKKKQKIKILLLSGLALIIIVIAAILILRRFDFFEKTDLPEIEISIPGSVEFLETSFAGDVEQMLLEGDTAAKLEQRLLNLNNTDYGISEWYQLPIRSESEPAKSSEILLASDQILYAKYLVEQNRLKDIVTWLDNFEKKFVDSGKVVKYIQVNDAKEITKSEISWEASLSYADLLLSIYSKDPQTELWSKIIITSEYLLSVFDNKSGPSANLKVAIPTAAPAPDPAATPTPRPVVSPVPEKTAEYDLIMLASVDIAAIRNLIQIDDSWQSVYDYWLEIIKGSLISEEMPLYALAVWPDHQTYLNYAGDQPEVNVEASLQILLNLCRVGEQDPRTLRWITDKMLNGFAVYESYNVIQGHAGSTEEVIRGYAMIARIARITEDTTLYNRAINRLSWHIATNQRSDALNAVFRQDDQGIIRVWSSDNIWSLLAFR